MKKNNSLKKLTGLGLILLCIGLVCGWPAESVSGQRSADASAAAANISQAARKQLKKLPAEDKDRQFPMDLREIVGQYRAILKKAVQFKKLDEAQLNQLTKEQEENLAALRGALNQHQEKGKLGECINDCETANSYCLRVARNGFDRYICNLESTGCLILCVGAAYGLPPNSR